MFYNALCHTFAPNSFSIFKDLCDRLLFAEHCVNTTNGSMADMPWLRASFAGGAWTHRDSVEEESWN
jgi:hypothetical protein